MSYDRPVRLTRAQSFWVGLALLTVGLIGSYAVWGAYWADWQIERNGIRTNAKILEKSKSTSSDGDNDHFLKYEFIVADKPVTTERIVNLRIWDEADVGEDLPIVYSLEDPNRNFPVGGGNTSFRLNLFLSSIWSLLAILGFAILWGFFRPTRQPVVDELSSEEKLDA